MMIQTITNTIECTNNFTCAALRCGIVLIISFCYGILKLGSSIYYEIVAETSSNISVTRLIWGLSFTLFMPMM